MNGACEGELVTPRARSLTLELVSDPAFRYRVERGDALRLAGRRPDGQVEVEYLQHRWVTSEDALQPLAALQRAPPAAVPTELPATSEASAVATPAWRRLPWWLFALAAVVALVVALVTLLRLVNGDGDEPTPDAPSHVADLTAAAVDAPPTPAPAILPPTSTAPRPTAMTEPPVVSNLVVCDATVDCGIGAGEFDWREFLACLRVTAGGDGGPLVLVATAADDPPADASSASVLARSGPIPQDPAFRCHAVRTGGAALTAGRYRLWALDGATVLAGVPFVVDSP